MLLPFPRREPRNSWYRCPGPRDDHGAAAAWPLTRDSPEEPAGPVLWLSPPGPQSSAGLEYTQILSPLHSLSGKCEKTGPRSALKPVPLPRLCLLSICLALELTLKCLEWSLNQGPCPRGIANQLWALGKPPASNSAISKWNLKYCLPARG